MNQVYTIWIALHWIDGTKNSVPVIGSYVNKVVEDIRHAGCLEASHSGPSTFTDSLFRAEVTADVHAEWLRLPGNAGPQRPTVGGDPLLYEIKHDAQVGFMDHLQMLIQVG